MSIGGSKNTTTSTTGAAVSATSRKNNSNNRLSSSVKMNRSPYNLTTADIEKLISGRKEDDQKLLQQKGGVNGIAQLLKIDLSRGLDSDTVLGRREIFGKEEEEEDTRIIATTSTSSATGGPAVATSSSHIKNFSASGQQNLQGGSKSSQNGSSSSSGTSTGEQTSTRLQLFLQLFLASAQDFILWMLGGSSIVAIVLCVTVEQSMYNCWVEGFSVIIGVILFVCISAVLDFAKFTTFANYLELRWKLLVDNSEFLVLRDGKELQVVGREIVIGDLVKVTTGDIVRFDGLLVHSSPDFCLLVDDDITAIVPSDNVALQQQVEQAGVEATDVQLAAAKSNKNGSRTPGAAVRQQLLSTTDVDLEFTDPAVASDEQRDETNDLPGAAVASDAISPRDSWIISGSSVQSGQGVYLVLAIGEKTQWNLAKEKMIAAANKNRSAKSAVSSSVAAARSLMLSKSLSLPFGNYYTGGAMNSVSREGSTDVEKSNANDLPVQEFYKRTSMAGNAEQQILTKRSTTNDGEDSVIDTSSMLVLPATLKQEQESLHGSEYSYHNHLPYGAPPGGSSNAAGSSSGRAIHAQQQAASASTTSSTANRPLTEQELKQLRRRERGGAEMAAGGMPSSLTVSEVATPVSVNFMAAAGGASGVAGLRMQNLQHNLRMSTSTGQHAQQQEQYGGSSSSTALLQPQSNDVLAQPERIGVPSSHQVLESNSGSLAALRGSASASSSSHHRTSNPAQLFSQHHRPETIQEENLDDISSQAATTTDNMSQNYVHQMLQDDEVFTSTSLIV
eukprot:GSA120T00019397001.1